MIESRQSAEQAEWNKKYASVRVTVSLNPVIFPLDFADLAQALKSREYDVTVEFPPAGVGRRVGGGGTIAKRGDISVVADSDRRFIGIDGRSPKAVLSSFEELTQILKDELWVDVGAQAAYYEVTMRLHVLARQSPTAAIGRFFQKLDGVQFLESIMGEPASLFTIRLVPKGKLPGDKEWFDIRIEPDTTRPEKAFAIEVVYRKASYGHVEGFVDSIDHKINAVLDKLE